MTTPLPPWQGWAEFVANPRGGAPAFVGLVANRNAMASTNTATNHIYNSRRAITLLQPTRFLKVALANWFIGSNPQEQNNGGAAVQAASIEFPANVILARATFGGAGIFQTTTPAGATAYSDFMDLGSILPAGTVIWLRRYFNNANGIIYLNGAAYVNAGAGDQMYTAAAGVTDWTGTASPISNGGGSNVSATSNAPAFLVLGPTTGPSIGVPGDSIGAGFNDTQNNTMQIGIVCRAIDSSIYAFANLASFGGQVNQWRNTPGYATERLAALKYFNRGCIQLGTNDFNVAGRTAAQVQADIEWLISQFPAGAKITVTTVTAKTLDSTAFWTQVGTQTGINNGPASPMANYNQAVINNSLAGQNNGHFDVAGPFMTSGVSGAAQSGVWDVSGARTVTDAAMGVPPTPTVTSATAAFAVSDVGYGARVAGAGAAGANLVNPIVLLNSPTSINLGANNSTSVSGQTANIRSKTIDGIHPVTGTVYALGSANVNQAVFN